MPASNHSHAHNTGSYYNPSVDDSDYDAISPQRTRSYIDDLNIDLLRTEQLLDSGDSIIPILDESYIADVWDGTQYPNLEVQSSMEHPYLWLEFIGSVALSVLLCGNDLMFSIITSSSMGQRSDPILRYVFSKLINLSFVALVPFVFTTADTYKSINITIEYLAVNIVVYEYSFVDILKYVGIQLAASILGAIISYGVYYEYVDHLTSRQILPNIFISAFTFRFNISYVVVSLLVHIAIAIALTVISNDCSSINAKKKTVQKALLFLFSGFSFGLFIGPVGHIVPQLCFYAIVIVAKEDFGLFNEHMFITYSVTVLGIILLYPLVAIQIKFYWRNRYRRYIEYGASR